MKRTDGYYPPHEYRGLKNESNEVAREVDEFLNGKKDESGRTIIKPIYFIDDAEELQRKADDKISELQSKAHALKDDERKKPYLDAAERIREKRDDLIAKLRGNKDVL